MALLVWLPLNGNLKNQGLNNITITNNGATINDSGKIGKCYLFGTNSSYISLPKETMNSFTTEASVCFWLKINTFNTAWATYFQAGTGSTPWTNYIFGFLRNSSASTCCFAIGNGATSSQTSYLTPNLSTEVWYHIGLIYKPNHCLIYLNGNLYNDFTTTIAVDFSKITNITIGKCNNGTSYQTDCLMNDIRIYNHALSPKEVSEIAKGLVLHYKLDLLNSPTSGINLIENGWGGTENWSPNTSNYVSTDVPTSPSGITNSYSNTTSKSYITIHPNHSYTVSEYVKKGTSTLGTLYISLIPYDIDKNRIAVINLTDGFKASSLTTLSLDLHNGDSIIHLTSTTGWTSLSTYQYFVAIFGYTDSTGYTYPDLVYTRRVYTFGTTTDKSNIDIANSQVTLNSPYSGETIPAGTSICISSAGATYYYPVTISASNATDWTLISKTFTPSQVNYLKAAKYVKVMPCLYNGQWAAGVTLVDNSANNLIYDSSGYKHDGICIGAPKLDSNTLRYNKSLALTNNDYITLENTCCNLSQPFSVSCWCKLTGSANLFTILINDINSNRSFNFGSNGGAINLTVIFTLPKGYFGVQKGAIKTGWGHYVMVYNGTTLDLYRDGTLLYALTITNTSYSSSPIENNIIKLYGANMSDFRIYATALSEQDIKELYNTAAFVYNNNKIAIYELNELESNLFTLNNWNLNAKNIVNWTTRNDELAVQLNANNFYYGANDTRNNCLPGLFKENTQYLFDMWIDYDAIVSGGTNRLGGIRIFYTDNTYSDTLTGVGDNNNLIGWQHKVFYSDISKSIKSLQIYYYTATGAFYRWDSIITPVSSEINILKTGVLNGTFFNNSSDVAQICKGGVINSSQFIEI